MLAVVLVISAVGATNYVEARETVEEDTRTQSRSTAHLQSDAVSEWIRHMRSQPRTISCAERFAAAAKRQTTALADVSLSAAGLGGRARRLGEVLDDFETDVDETDASGSVPGDRDGASVDGDGDAFEAAGDDPFVDADSKDRSFEEILDSGE